MTFTARFPRYHDPWLDNGLETLYDLVEASRALEVLTAILHPQGVELAFNDLDAAARWLDQALELRAESYLCYDFRSREGMVRQQLHEHLVFRSQPAIQYPDLFRRTPQPRESAAEPGASPVPARLRLLRAALAVGAGQVTGQRPRTWLCPFCGLSSTEPLLEVTQGVYPLATKAPALSGARHTPGGRRRLLAQAYQRACPRCILVGSLTWVDGALLFHTVAGSRERPGWSTLLLPDPTGLDLGRLHELKSQIRLQVRRRHRLTNLFLSDRPGGSRPRGEVSDGEGGRPAPGTTAGLLLAYLEESLLTAGQPGGDLCETARTVPDLWLELHIPGGRMKNLRGLPHVLENAFVRREAAWVREGRRPALWVSGLDVFRLDGRPMQDAVRRRERLIRQEAVARALVEGAYDAFARAFVPRAGLGLRSLGPWDVFVADLQRMLEIWRGEYKVTVDQLELLRKGGQTLGRIGTGRSNLVYKLERSRRFQDLLEVLAEVGHYLAGAGPKELTYLSLTAVDDLTRLVASEALPYEEIRNTLVLYAGLELARQRYMEAQAARGGDSSQSLAKEASERAS